MSVDFDLDDDERPAARRFLEWECPACTAHNPADDGFTFGDDVFCFYCGSEFAVRERDGRPRFVPA